MLSGMVIGSRDRRTRGADLQHLRRLGTRREVLGSDPMPPSWAIAMASRASVTVSIAAEMIGMLIRMLRSPGPEETSRGRTVSGRDEQDVVEGQRLGDHSHAEGARRKAAVTHAVPPVNSLPPALRSLTPPGKGFSVLHAPPRTMS
jgi:hypothetical protein